VSRYCNPVFCGAECTGQVRPPCCMRPEQSKRRVFTRCHRPKPPQTGQGASCTAANAERLTGKAIAPNQRANFCGPTRCFSTEWAETGLSLRETQMAALRIRVRGKSEPLAPRTSSNHSEPSSEYSCLQVKETTTPPFTKGRFSKARVL